MWGSIPRAWRRLRGGLLTMWWLWGPAPAAAGSAGGGTFAGLIDAADRDETILLVARPRVDLDQATLAKDQTNAYQVPMPRFVGTSQIKGGVYRRVLGVKEDGVLLDMQPSLALVEANPGSWFWDERATLQTLADIDHETGDLSAYDSTVGNVAAHAEAAIAGSYGLRCRSVDYIVDHETGDLSQYDATVGGVSASAAAAMVGGFGLAVTKPADTGPDYAEIDLTGFNPSGSYTVSFWFDPNSLTMANADTFVLAWLISTGGSSSSRVVVDFQFLTSAGYRIRARFWDDAGNPHTTSWLAGLSDEEHLIQCVVTKASSDVASDGKIDMWVDRVLHDSVESIDIFDDFIPDDVARFGFASASDAGTVGTLYIDDVWIKDTSFGTIADCRLLTPFLRSSHEYQFALRFDPNGSAIGPTQTIIAAMRRVNGGVLLAGLVLDDGGSPYRVALIAYDDTFTGQQTDWINITDAAHLATCTVRRATSLGAADGEIILDVDGTRVELTGVDLFDGPNALGWQPDWMLEVGWTSAWPGDASAGVLYIDDVSISYPTPQLYVHTTTGAAPDTFTAYQALVEFRFATRPALLNLTDDDDDTGVYHHPWLVGQLPVIVERDDEQLFGPKLTSGTRVDLLNAASWWDRIVAHDGPYHWKQAEVELLCGGAYDNGGQVLPLSAYETLTTLRVRNLTASEGVVTLELAPLVSRLTEKLPYTPLFGSNLGEGVSGTKAWIGYGRATMRPDLTDDSSHGVYTIADAAYQTLFAVNSVTAVNKSTRARVGLTLTTDYTVDLTACTVTIVNATYAWQSYEIEVDVSGKPDGAGSYLKTFGEIVRDILETRLSVPSSQIDTAAFAQADEDNQAELSLWLKDPRSVASILATAQDGFPALERSVQGLILQTAAGLWTASIWNPAITLSALPTLRKSQFARFDPEPPLDRVISRVTVHYNRNLFSGEWDVIQETDAEVAYQDESDDELVVYTFLRTASDARTLAQRLLTAGGGRVLDVEFEEAGITQALARPRTRVAVTFDPAPVWAGSLTDAPFEIVELERRLSPTLTVAGRLRNLRGIGEHIGTWMDSAAPDYVDATLAERAASGFWADSYGDLVEGNAATRNQSVWW